MAYSDFTFDPPHMSSIFVRKTKICPHFLALSRICVVKNLLKNYLDSVDIQNVSVKRNGVELQVKNVDDGREVTKSQKQMGEAIRETANGCEKVTREMKRRVDWGRGEKRKVKGAQKIKEGKKKKTVLQETSREMMGG